MATPLSSLSKYGGVLMAVLCVLLMVSFLVGDTMQFAGGGGGGSSSRANNPVATWRGGTVNERQLDQAVQHRSILAAFQQAVYEIGTRDAMEDGVEDLGLRIQPLTLPRTREEGVEGHVVQTKIFAQRAREAGMVVSDKMIVDYLRSLGRDRVSNEQMRQILSRMNSGGSGKATIAFVFDLLREAMLANNYLTSHAFAFRTILPEERWEDWKMVNERVVVEAAPIETTAFVAEAPEPTDAELEEFYNLYREREPSSDFLRGYGNVELPSPLPAFAVPARVKLAYLKADFNVALEAATKEVTEEQIAAFYEENKESFIQADRALFGDDDAEKDDAEEPATEETSEEAATEETKTEEAETSAADDAPAAEAGAADEAPATEEAASENPLRSGEATEEEEEEEEEKKPTAEATEGSAEDSAASETDEDTPYQPLEEVSDEIRRRLAIDIAMKRVGEKMEGLLNGLEDEYFAYEDAVEKAAGAKSEAPTPPASLTDLKPLAEREGLELVEIDQASQMGLRETPVGASRNTSSSDPASLPAWVIVFRTEEPLSVYEPLLTRDADGNHYLVLVTERYKAERPALADIRESVVAAWKKSKAAELALTKAKELAKSATESSGSLKDFLAGAENPPVKADAIVETDAFSLLTIGPIAPNARQVPLRLSQPEPLVAAGPELLQSVFDLKAGEVGAALNHDHSLAYVLRIAEKIGTEDELRREFVRDGDRWIGGDALTQTRTMNKVRALVGNLLDESGLEWERTADELR